jgi:hypothetical protein
LKFDGTGIKIQGIFQEHTMKTNLAKRIPRRLQKSLSRNFPVAGTHAAGFFSFTYSHREISQSGGKTRIRSREYRFENGKLQSEEFDGTLDGSVYFDAVDQAHELMLARTRDFLGFFSAFLPFSSKGK